ncbi:hypothetical protein BCV70DRAFT_197953 [Testicularia cyperi]|uniref:Uncharacterized protein n=1 Tax=Testicularia cyperi TaxID=1882483 RepID=A0A317XZN8_9BASI|nr:hypothetical protein BCV70DRAFT_197953 [Testicularia cyperi]
MDENRVRESQQPHPSTNNSSTNPASSAFVSSSSDFALPFGSKAAKIAQHGFPSANYSVPISIPASPSLQASSATDPSNSSSIALSLSSSNRQPAQPGFPSSPLRQSPRHAPLHVPGNASNGAGLGIGGFTNPASPPARDVPNPLYLNLASIQPGSPSHQSQPVDGWPGSHTTFNTATSPSVGPTTAAALLRRGPNMTSPGFGLASPARFRRASMLGREITPFHLDHDADDEEKPSNDRANNEAEDGDDELMNMEEDSAPASRAPSTPLMGPPAGLFGGAAGNNGGGSTTPSTPPSISAAIRKSAAPTLTRMSVSDSGQESSSSSSTGATRPPSGSPSATQALGSRSRSSSLLSGNVVRRSVTKRGNLMPRDLGVLRVAATLQDETRPEDSEIASEAKLQKRLGGESTLPRTPRMVAASSTSSTYPGSAGASKMSRSPFFGGRSKVSSSNKKKYMWDDEDLDDIRGVFAADGLDDDDSSEFSSDGEEVMVYYSRTGPSSDEEDERFNSRPADANTGANGTTTADDEMLEDSTGDLRQEGSTTTAGGVDGATAIEGVGASSGAPGTTGGNAGPGTPAAAGTVSTSFGAASVGSSNSLPKRKGSLWMGFREKGNIRRGAAAGGAAGGFIGGAPGSAGLGLGIGTTGGMDVETSPRIYAVHSSASAASASGSGGAAPGSSRIAKRKILVGEDRYEPYKRRAVSPMNLGSSLNNSGSVYGGYGAAAAAVAAAAGGPTGAGVGVGVGNSPSVIPISSPSGAAAYRTPYTYTRYSTSPTISRPCTPTNTTHAHAHAHNAHLSSATAATTAAGWSASTSAVCSSAFSPAATGSGPGYGSGALGLSISANPPLSPSSDENDAMDQRVGMLGLS